MTSRSNAPLFVGGAAVVLLSGIAGFLGGRMSQDASSPLETEAPLPPPSDVVLESMERRIADIGRRLDLLEMREPPVETSLVAPSAPVAPPTRPAAGDPSSPGAAPVEPASTKAGTEAGLEDLRRRTGREFLAGFIRTLADATPKGAEDRRVQANVDAQFLATRFGVRSDDGRAQIRTILDDQWSNQARDVGPLLRGGLEKADIATVRDRMKASWDETDRRIQPLLDETAWKDYQTEMNARHETFLSALDEIERGRSGGR
jgi:hypothetical protein